MKIIPLRFRANCSRFSVFVILALAVGCVSWQGLAQAAETSGDKAAQVNALKAELDAAADKAKAIINQPVAAYRRTPGMDVGIYSPGWFHEGATKPNFKNVDVRQSQELIYTKHQYVTSDLNPGLVFLGRDLEFNGMTKYFYTNRSLPKKRLTEAQMLEVNRLYRIIGECEQKIRKLERPDLRPLELAPDTETVEDDLDAPLVRQPVPKGNYLKAATGIVAVLGVYVLYRLLGALMKKKFGRR